jgi:putative ABC transport system substrate-binding protein
MKTLKNRAYRIGKIVCMFMLLAGLVACSRPPEKHYTIGIINPNRTNTDLTKGFIAEMAEFGYVRNKNVTYIIHSVPEDIDSAANDLASRKVDLIFVFTTPAAKKAKAATKKSIPIVFAVYDPVKSGLIGSLTEPDGNLTGIQIRGSTPKSLEWLLTLAPDMKNIFIPVKFDTSAARQDLADVKKAAGLLGLKLFTAEVNTVPELDAALAGMPENIDALFLTRSIFTASNVKRIVDQAISRKLPVGSSTSMFKHGVTITYGVESFHVGRQAARLADMILRGMKPENIPAEISDYFLGVNMNTAHASGITVSNETLLRADFVIGEKKQKAD